MWWFVIMILGVLLFALLIDLKRKKRRNDRHVQGIHPSTKPGEDQNYTMGGGHDSGNGTGQ
ncbi:hypothetical protein ACFQWC_12145 [Rossellomorea sp. GCM10028870]|uniref:hypothetical protein n=1 Tax=Rossellomorea sp. GCM10028870 TaxID=3273426 RepID=UPI0036242BEF